MRLNTPLTERDTLRLGDAADPADSGASVVDLHTHAARREPPTS
jgi:hypothetical protein